MIRKWWFWQQLIHKSNLFQFLALGVTRIISKETIALAICHRALEDLHVTVNLLIVRLEHQDLIRSPSSVPVPNTRLPQRRASIPMLKQFHLCSVPVSLARLAQPYCLIVLVHTVLSCPHPDIAVLVPFLNMLLRRIVVGS